ncbi:MAG TPA: hypothetical protein VJT50_00335 [Pyrinomonadaceae bacterium]|nr:hypothetical protein [Pyrinomonadaceae bacterium]
MPRLDSAKVFHSALAIALSFWVAGAGCLLGCGGMTANAAPLSEQIRSQPRDLAAIVSAEACASKSHDCCAKHKAESKPPAADTATRDSTVQSSLPASGGMEGCPLAMSRSAVTSTSVHNRDTQAVVLTHTLTAPPTQNSELPLNLVAKLPLPNGGHTYLRCCSFLI